MTKRLKGWVKLFLIAILLITSVNGSFFRLVWKPKLSHEYMKVATRVFFSDEFSNVCVG